MNRHHASELTLAGAIALLLAAQARSDTVVLSTADNPIDGSFWNQGWWGSGVTNANTANVSPLIGYCDMCGFGTGRYRDYFTFLLPPAVPQNPVVSAALLQHRGVSSSMNELEETIGFFDVATSPSTLNNNVGTNLSIYDDLGTGVNYGEFVIPGQGSSDTLLEFALNSAAVASINAHAGMYFSTGGSLLTAELNDYVFGGDTHGPAELRLVRAAEPTTLSLIGSMVPLLLCTIAVRKIRTIGVASA